jgi:hypothetical protein
VAKGEWAGVTDVLVLEVKGVLGERRIHGITLHLMANLNRTQTYYLENDGEMLEQSETYTNDGGHDGAPGQPGMEPNSPLEDGINGPNGSVQIFIKEQNERVLGPFASPFHLDLFDFEVIDSNEDGIFEFGEEILLGNIRVRNSGSRPSNPQLTAGGTPSPKFAEVTMMGASSDWVSTVNSLSAPRHILNNSIIVCPGTLTLRVKRATVAPVGTPLIVTETLSVAAWMNKIERWVPGFNRVSRNITLQHPIQIPSKPKYLRCLTSGTEAVFSLTVNPLLLPKLIKGGEC